MVQQELEFLIYGPLGFPMSERSQEEMGLLIFY